MVIMIVTLSDRVGLAPVVSEQRRVSDCWRKKVRETIAYSSGFISWGAMMTSGVAVFVSKQAAGAGLSHPERLRSK